MMIALVSLYLLQLLTGCGNSRIVYVKVLVVPLPASLIAEMSQPVIPDPLPYEDSLDLNVSLLSSLGQCNRDKANIRAIENQRLK